MTTAAVRARGLAVTRGGAAVLHELDLDVAAGEVTGLLGPSGSGKTTVMRVVVGVQHVDAGSVEVLGLPAGSAALRRRVGYVSQQPSVYDDLTVVENLRFFARVLGVDRAQMDACVRTVDLGAHAHRVVSRLSGGERSRVSLAVAMLGRPDLLVLDEPTVGLDPVLRAELWGTFRALAAAGAAVLVSSHVMDEATRCDRLLLLRKGRLVADDSPAGLLASTAAPDMERAFLEVVRRGGAR